MVSVITILELFGLLIGLVGIYVVFNLFQRTKDGLRNAITFIGLALIMFVFARLFNIINEYALLESLLVAKIFNLIFILMFVIGIYNIKVSFDKMDGKK